MDPSARSLTLDLLSSLRRGSMPVRALVAAGAIFGIEENNIRVSLARLCAAGSVERDARGRYRLGERARGIQARLADWRRPGTGTRAWDGSWIGVHAASRPRVRSASRQRAERARQWLGFRPLAEGLCVRPNNLPGGIRRARRQLHELGLEAGASVFRIRDLDPETERRARALWDVAALRRGYTRSLRDLERSRARLAKLGEERAMVETFRVGGRVLHQLAIDPALPEPIADPTRRDALRDAMRAYDRLGRACWAQFLSHYDVPHTRWLVGLRLPEAPAKPRPCAAIGESG